MMCLDEIYARTQQGMMSLEEFVDALSKQEAAQPVPLEPTEHKACPSHCCPVHGCKYGYTDCPVVLRSVVPTYPGNNGCEDCSATPAPQEPAEPVAWIPLTEDQLDELYNTHGYKGDVEEFVQVVSSMLKENNATQSVAN
jgi:hypothetical protein